jgi:hypothetical protein
MSKEALGPLRADITKRVEDAVVTKRPAIVMSKHSLKKMAANGADLIAAWHPGATVTVIVEYPDGKRFEVTRGVLKGSEVAS